MLDYVAIFKELNRRRIRYIVVGGLAVNFYGIPRMTYDIDLLLDLEDRNLKRFLSIVKKWGFKPKIPVNIMDFSKEEKRKEWVRDKDMRAFNLINPKWPILEIDIIIRSPIDYRKAKRNIKYIRTQNVKIPLISIDDLMRMKKHSSREQDRQDLIYLKKIKNAQKKGI
jgi:hypothetical protein